MPYSPRKHPPEGDPPGGDQIEGDQSEGYVPAPLLSSTSTAIAFAQEQPRLSPANRSYPLPPPFSSSQFYGSSVKTDEELFNPPYLQNGGHTAGPPDPWGYSNNPHASAENAGPSNHRFSLSLRNVNSHVIPTETFPPVWTGTPGSPLPLSGHSIATHPLSPSLHIPSHASYDNAEPLAGPSRLPAALSSSQTAWSHTPKPIRTAQQIDGQTPPIFAPNLDFFSSSTTASSPTSASRPLSAPNTGAEREGPPLSPTESDGPSKGRPGRVSEVWRRELEDIERDSGQTLSQSERRRLQNRVAQKMHRAKAKVDHADNATHRTGLEKQIRAQGFELDRLHTLVDSLQRENSHLRSGIHHQLQAQSQQSRFSPNPALHLSEAAPSRSHLSEGPSNGSWAGLHIGHQQAPRFVDPTQLPETRAGNPTLPEGHDGWYQQPPHEQPFNPLMHQPVSGHEGSLPDAQDQLLSQSPFLHLLPSTSGPPSGIPSAGDSSTGYPDIPESQGEWAWQYHGEGPDAP